jgi:DNA repair protein SbcD/Mre11
MKFAHMADCHIGGWNDSKMRELSHKAFEKATKICLQEKVDFVLIAGDLFNTALPGIDTLKVAVENLKLLADNQIKVYVIPGSHDYSPSGKTILDVLEKADLLVNVFRFDDGQLSLTVDQKTKSKITGIIGRRGGLEMGYYEAMNKLAHQKEDGFKIFMFHSALKELVPDTNMDLMEHIELSNLPKGFDYYAGGHVHIIADKRFDGYGIVSYPGPLFPNNFSELEELKAGGFYIAETVDEGQKQSLVLRYMPISLSSVLSVELDCDDKTPEEINAMLMSQIDKKELKNTILTVRLSGELKSGKTTDIDFRSFLREAYDRGAYFVMKNSNKLTSKEFKEIKIKDASIDKIEEMIIDENQAEVGVDGWDTDTQKKVVKNLMHALDKEKEEGESTADFENRVREDGWKAL